MLQASEITRQNISHQTEGTTHPVHPRHAALHLVGMVGAVEHHIALGQRQLRLGLQKRLNLGAALRRCELDVVAIDLDDEIAEPLGAQQGHRLQQHLHALGIHQLAEKPEAVAALPAAARAARRVRRMSRPFVTCTNFSAPAPS